MYWLQPPNHLKRIAAVLLVVAAVAWDLRSQATELYPVAARPLAAGTAIDDSAIEWIQLPVSRLPTPDLAAVTAARDIETGEPLTDALLQGPVSVPDGWWTVPIVIGTTARAGDDALLVVADPPISVVGLVVTPQVGDRYSLDHRPAGVAVPADVAAVIAAAEQQGLLVSAIRTGGDRQ